MPFLTANPWQSGGMPETSNTCAEMSWRCGSSSLNRWWECPVCLPTLSFLFTEKPLTEDVQSRLCYKHPMASKRVSAASAGSPGSPL
eukprot:scaffold304292_cov21-Tisochrysis_lutea.AAC.1